MSDYQAGDIGFSTSRGLIPWAIVWAQMRKYGKNSTAARWNHCFVMVGPTQLVEATDKGVVLGDLSGYADQEYAIYRPKFLNPHDGNMVADWVTRRLGDKYSYSTAVCLALSMLTGTRLRFGISGSYLCSGLAAAALSSVGIWMGDDEEWSSPGDVRLKSLQYGWERVL